jgi:hypothetical protein
LIRKKATERLAIRSPRMPPSRRIQAPRARPPAPLAGTIAPAPSSDKPISQLVHHGMLWQKMGGNSNTYDTRDMASNATASATHSGRASLNRSRTSPSPEASGSTRPTTASNRDDLERAPGQPAWPELVRHLHTRCAVDWLHPEAAEQPRRTSAVRPGGA